jgi:hypothetical protein
LTGREALTANRPVCAHAFTAPLTVCHFKGSDPRAI